MARSYLNRNVKEELAIMCFTYGLPEAQTKGKVWEGGGGTNPALTPGESDALLGAPVFPVWPPADLQRVIP